MNKTLSITVPAYNVEQFLDHTLRSFVSETILNDIEVLVIDDGSTDKTSEVAQLYQEKYPQTFKLVSKENGGHGSTINTGIRLATGKYYKVVDGDDWVLTKNLEKYIKLLKSTDADLIATNYCEFDNISKSELIKSYKNVKYNSIYLFDDIPDNLYIPMHSMTIKTAIFKDNNICIDENCYYVDNEYAEYPIPYVNSVVFYDIPIYMYRVNNISQSVSFSGFQKHEQEHKKVIMNIITFINACKQRGNLSEFKENYFINYISKLCYIQYLIYLDMPGRDRKKILQKFRIYDECLKAANIDIYRKASLHFYITFMRKTNFTFFSQISIIRNIYLKLKKIFHVLH